MAVDEPVDWRPKMMQPEADGGRPSPKLLAGANTKVRIATVSILILVVGAWLAPRAAQTTLTVPQEHAAPLLEEQAQREEASRTFVGVQDIAAAAREHSVAISLRAPVAAQSRNDFSEPGSELPRPTGVGVFVTDTYVLTHSVALDGQSSVRLALDGDATVEARLVAYEPPTGLVLLQTSRSGRTPAPLAAAAPPTGALAVGVGGANAGDVAVPVFVTRAAGGRYEIGGVNEALLPGMPLFNLAGELFAIAAPGAREIEAIPVRAAAERLQARASSGERLSSFGIGFMAVTGLPTRTFGEAGVVITDVVEGGPADREDVRVGDVLLTIAGAPVDSVEAAIRQLSSAPLNEVTRLRLRRAGQNRDVDVMPALAFEVASLARAGSSTPPGPEARVVFSATVLEQSAIPASAQVLSVNGRPVTSRAQALRELRRARPPVPVLLRHGDNRFFVGIEPER